MLSLKRCIEADSYISSPRTKALPPGLRMREMFVEENGKTDVNWRCIRNRIRYADLRSIGRRKSDCCSALLALMMFAQAYLSAVSKHVGIGNWLQVPADVIVLSLFKKMKTQNIFS